ncbi:uncharacterized protein LOC131888382 isoform X2 [Tigriopus californicus]|uniref:uncharacterized protein LOC131888382 isoform X2 n=1 Tax=Tigriopus californicus TaxID=6832 RepID=UPI0027DA48BC|nr:uncharacterized protein LOC131888382 isoform X2 [Tigriopus californicus]
MSLSNVWGEIKKSKRVGIYVHFLGQNGGSQTACLYPGKSYVNGCRLLLDACQSDAELSCLFPKGTWVCFDAIHQPGHEGDASFHQSNDNGSSHQTEEGQGSDGISPLLEAENPAQDQSIRRCEWLITMLWSGPSKPNGENLKNGYDFAKENHEFQQLVQHNLSAMPSRPVPGTDFETSSATSQSNWFVKNLKLLKSTSILPHPDTDPNAQTSPGIIQSVHLPEGGIISLQNGYEVFCHRGRAYSGTRHCALHCDLSDFLAVGQNVSVTFVSNRDEHGQEVYFSDLPAPWVALACFVNTSIHLDVPRILFEHLDQDQDKFFVAKIISFDCPLNGEKEEGVAGGVAELLSFDELSSLAFSKERFQRSIVTQPKVKRVRFHRSRLIHLGMSLAKADLRYFFSPYAFAMNIFYCHIRQILENTQQLDGIHHEVSIGWKNSISFLHSTAQDVINVPTAKPDDSLFLPRLASFQTIKFLSLVGLDVVSYENLLDGVHPPRGSSHLKHSFGRVVKLMPASTQNASVSRGFIMAESGTFMGQSLAFKKSQLQVFGFQVGGADLRRLLDLNDEVFFDTRNEKNTPKITNVFIGCQSPTKHPFSAYSDLSRHQFRRFLLFLDRRGLTMSEFFGIISEKNPSALPFVPFPGEENRGTVIHLVRNWVTHQKAPLEQNHSHASLAVGGVIRVDRGPSVGQLVYFHNRNCWVLGYNLRMADLSHIFIVGQKVSLEVSESSHSFDDILPGESIKLFATIVWTSKFRPRCVPIKTVPRSSHVENWLGKRNLDWDRFQRLILGCLPPVPEHWIVGKPGNMLQAYKSDISLKMSNRTDLVNLPVFRHGQQATRKVLKWRFISKELCPVH